MKKCYRLLLATLLSICAVALLHVLSTDASATCGDILPGPHMTNVAGAAGAAVIAPHDTPTLTLSAGQVQTTTPGNALVYTHGLTNTYPYLIAFRVTASNDQDWALVYDNLDAVAQGQTATVPIEVQVPLAAAGTARTTITVSWMTVDLVSHTIQVTDTTVVEAPPVTGTLTLSPGMRQEAEPGAVITYTHTLTNSYLTSQAVTLTAHSSQGWLLNHHPTLTVPAQGTAPLTVTVDVPGDADSVTDTLTFTATWQIDAETYHRNAVNVTVVPAQESPPPIYLPLVTHSYFQYSAWSRAGLAGHTVYQIAVCKQNPARLYAGTENGLYSSRDWGNTWQHGGFANILVRGVAIAHNDCDNVYAATWGQYVQHSTDGGASWATLSNGFPEQYLYTVEVDAAGTLYAGTGGTGDVAAADSGVYVWENGSWQQIFAGVHTVTRVIWDAELSWLLVASWGDSAYRLAKIGESWQATSLGISQDYIFAVVPGAITLSPPGKILYAATTASLHLHYPWQDWSLVYDHRAYSVAVDPDDTDVIYVATEAGVMRSLERGDNGLTPYGLTGQTVRCVATGPAGAPLLYAGTTDGVWRRSQ